MENPFQEIDGPEFVSISFVRIEVAVRPVRTIEFLVVNLRGYR